MARINEQASVIERFPTDVVGMDVLLHGGLKTGSVYILQGLPGTGKTVLGNQIAFNAIRRGGRALYLTLLGESHGRLTSHLKGFSFYDPKAITDSISYVSAYNTMATEGMNGMLRLIATEARNRSATLVVVDGLFVLEEVFQSDLDFRKFINDLAHHAELLKCVVLLLTNSRRPPTSPEYALVDGWLTLGTTQMGYRSLRYMEIHKFRGSNFISGLHSMVISDQGIRVIPRLETVEGFNPGKGVRDDIRQDAGVAGLNAILGGGFPTSSTTLMMGPPGVGKTSMGLQILSRSTREAPGMLFGFYETSERLQAKARALGLHFQDLIQDGRLHMLWYPPTDVMLDQIGHDLLDAVRRHGIKRLVVDGIGPLQKALVAPGRVGHFLAALTNALRELGCTAVFTAEVPAMSSGDPELPFGNLSAIAENILQLRYLEMRSTVKRALRVIKVRESQFDPMTHELFITGQGLRTGRSVDNPASLPGASNFDQQRSP